MLNLERKVKNKVNYESYFFFLNCTLIKRFSLYEKSTLLHVMVYSILKWNHEKQQIEKNRDVNERSDFD